MLYLQLGQKVEVISANYRGQNWSPVTSGKVLIKLSREDKIFHKILHNVISENDLHNNIYSIREIYIVVLAFLMTWILVEKKESARQTTEGLENKLQGGFHELEIENYG